MNGIKVKCVNYAHCKNLVKRRSLPSGLETARCFPCKVERNRELARKRLEKIRSEEGAMQEA